MALARRLLEANGVLEKRIGQLEDRVRQLEWQVSRNSGNSSVPPSADDLPGWVKPAPKRMKSTGRKRGKQKGAGGAAMPWVAVPDERVPHRPRGRCGCGADLAEADDVGIERSHQVHDLPEVRIRLWQHEVYRVRCGCGAEHVGSLPNEVLAAPSSYGPNLKSLVVYLLVYQHVPVQRCVRLIADLTGGSGPLEGFVHGMLSRCAAAVAEVATVIKTLITLAYVAGFDETTVRCGPAGAKKYVLSAAPRLPRPITWVAGTWSPSPRPGSCRNSPGWQSTTATPTTSITAGTSSSDTKRVWRIYCVISPMPPRPTPMPTGLPRRNARCAA